MGGGREIWRQCGGQDLPLSVRSLKDLKESRGEVGSQGRRERRG